MVPVSKGYFPRGFAKLKYHVSENASSAALVNISDCWQFMYQQIAEGGLKNH